MEQEMQAKAFATAAIGKEATVLNGIHDPNVNIAIYERSITPMEKEIEQLLTQEIRLKLTGNRAEIMQSFMAFFKEQKCSGERLLEDISHLLELFEKLTHIKGFQVFFSTISTDMCRRFHTDIHDLRLLCTYFGPATLWLPEEAADRNAHHIGEDNDQIVKDKDLVQQANAGDVLILKGALYPQAKAVLHRSPRIEKTGQKRLMLRIDTNKV